MPETFKDKILEDCYEKNDKQAEDVLLRIQAAVSDLHVADAQYHKNWSLIYGADNFDANISS